MSGPNLSEFGKSQNQENPVTRSKRLFNYKQRNGPT